MNSKDILILEVLFHAQCELEAMKAENAQRAIEDKSMAYTEEAFIDLSEQTRLKIRNIS